MVLEKCGDFPFDVVFVFGVLFLFCGFGRAENDKIARFCDGTFKVLLKTTTAPRQFCFVEEDFPDELRVIRKKLRID